MLVWDPLEQYLDRLPALVQLRQGMGIISDSINLARVRFMVWGLLLRVVVGVGRRMVVRVGMVVLGVMAVGVVAEVEVQLRAMVGMAGMV
jgi:hypothetical protein